MKKSLKLLLTGLIFIVSMKTSQATINKIKADEGFMSKAYKDSKNSAGQQLYSIGFGHQIRPNEQHLLTAALTRLQAENILKQDISPLELQVNQAVPKGFNQNQFDTCIMFGYNCGSGALSKALAVWNTSHSSDKFTAYIKQYVHTKDNTTGETIVSPALVQRRNADAALFTSKVMPGVIPLIAVAGIGLAVLTLT